MSRLLKAQDECIDYKGDEWDEFVTATKARNGIPERVDLEFECCSQWVMQNHAPLVPYFVKGQLTADMVRFMIDEAYGGVAEYDYAWVWMEYEGGDMESLHKEMIALGSRSERKCRRAVEWQARWDCENHPDWRLFEPWCWENHGIPEDEIQSRRRAIWMSAGDKMDADMAKSVEARQTA